MTTAMQPRDKLIPWYFVAFFVALAVVDGTMVTLAVRTQTGTVTNHPYEKGLRYNQVVAAAEHQNALGWKGEITFAANTLNFHLYDAAGNPLMPDNATATFTRPTQAGMDFSVTLTKGKAAVTLPAKGLWEIRVYATRRDRHYQHAKRIVAE